MGASSWLPIAAILLICFAAIWYALQIYNTQTPNTATQCAAGQLIVDGVCRPLQAQNLAAQTSVSNATSAPTCANLEKGNLCHTLALQNRCTTHATWMMRNCEKSCAQNGHAVRCALRDIVSSQTSAATRNILLLSTTGASELSEPMSTPQCSLHSTQEQCMSHYACGWVESLSTCIMTRNVLCGEESSEESSEAFCANAPANNYCDLKTETYDYDTRICQKTQLEILTAEYKKLTNVVNNTAVPQINSCAAKTAEATCTGDCQWDGTSCIVANDFCTCAGKDADDCTGICKSLNVIPNCTIYTNEADCAINPLCTFEGEVCTNVTEHICVRNEYECINNPTNPKCATCNLGIRPTPQSLLEKSDQLCHKIKSKTTCEGSGCAWTQEQCQYGYNFLLPFITGAVESKALVHFSATTRHAACLAANKIPSVGSIKGHVYVVVDNVPIFISRGGQTSQGIVLPFNARTVDIYHPSTVEAPVITCAAQDSAPEPTVDGRKLVFAPDSAVPASSMNQHYGDGEHHSATIDPNLYYYDHTTPSGKNLGVIWCHTGSTAPLNAFWCTHPDEVALALETLNNPEPPTCDY